MANERARLVHADRTLVTVGGLAEFVKLAWSQVDPAPLRWNWHHDVVCHHLEAVTRGEIRKLVIMVPPGTTKTLLSSVFWPAWEWTTKPESRWITASYGTIALHAARLHRELVRSPWYAERWPGTEIPYATVRAAGHFRTSAGGMRWTTTVGGALTSIHGGTLLADDLNKAQDAMGGAAYSLTALDGSWLFWSRVMPTRQTDPATTRRVLIGQRLHERDVPGRWIEEDPDVHVLCLPMRYSASHPHADPDDPRAEGELLWSDHIPEAEVAELEEVLGPLDASAQLQQLPIPAGGAVFNREWICHYDEPARAGRTVQSWDLAFKGAASSDHVVGQVWRRAGDEAELLDQVRGRWDFPATVDRLVDLTLSWPESARECLIEDKANGPAVEAELRRSFVERCKARGISHPPPLRIVLVNPAGGKLARAHAVTGLLAAGHVRFPRSASWLPELLHEVLRFTGRGAEQDDQVDAMTQALTHLFGSQKSRWLEAMERYRAAQRGAEVA